MRDLPVLFTSLADMMPSDHRILLESGEQSIRSYPGRSTDFDEERSVACLSLVPPVPDGKDGIVEAYRSIANRASANTGAPDPGIVAWVGGTNGLPDANRPGLYRDTIR